MQAGRRYRFVVSLDQDLVREQVDRWQVDLERLTDHEARLDRVHPATRRIRPAGAGSRSSGRTSEARGREDGDVAARPDDRNDIAFRLKLFEREHDGVARHIELGRELPRRGQAQSATQPSIADQVPQLAEDLTPDRASGAEGPA